MINLDEIIRDCDADDALAQNATKGPWYVLLDDDDMSMNCVGVSTSKDCDSPETRYSEIVALTLYQSKRVVDHSAGKWDEDASFIAEARTRWPAATEQRRALIAEVERLREDVATLRTAGKAVQKLGYFQEHNGLALMLNEALAKTEATPDD